MNTLVVYDSINGNTQKVAEEIAQAVEANGGEADSVRLIRIQEFTPEQLADADLLILGAPIRQHGVSPGVMRILGSLPACSLHGMAIAAFDTRYGVPAWLSGSAAVKMARLLRRLGARQVAPAESFKIVTKQGPLSPGELERAEVWAASVVERAAAG